VHQVGFHYTKLLSFCVVLFPAVQTVQFRIKCTYSI